MAIKKSDIYRSLWESCDQLRGGMDASLYKDYILTLLFVKYVSDCAGQPDALVEVPQGASFDDMKALRGSKDIGEGVDTIIARIAEENDLSGVIDRAFFNDPEKFGRGTKMINTLTALINIFSREELNFSKNRVDGDDILGDAYEYLMRNFATEAGKSKGQFYTPAEVSRIVASVAGVSRATSPKQSVYDPTCGSGSLLLKAAETAAVPISIFGQEMDIATRGLARMNMIMHNRATAEIAQGDVIAEPHFMAGPAALQTFDFVVANPPFSAKAWASGLTDDTRYGRFDDGEPPAKNGDFAFLLHILASMKATGSGAVILPHGVLFHGNAESRLREKLLKRGYIRGIIGLPANLFYGTGIPASIIVLDKSEACANRPVFMIDASKGFIKDGNKNRLRERDIHRITDAFTQQHEIAGFSRLVPCAEIARYDFNLNIPRYIDGSDPEDLQDITAHLHGGVPERDIDALRDFWDVMPTVRATLFGPNPRKGYADPLVSPDRVRSTIRNHPDFAAFRAQIADILNGWVTQNTPHLKSITQGDHPKDLINTISEDMLVSFAAAPLVDKYEAYQRLMSYWAATMQDDVFIIAGSGWFGCKDIREARSELDKDGKIKWVEDGDLIVKQGRKNIRIVAEAIPPALIVNRFFLSQKEKLESLQQRSEELGRDVEELIEEHGVEGGHLFEVVSEDGKTSQKDVKDRLKFRGLDQEEISILRDLLDRLVIEAAAKKAAKEADAKLTGAVLKKYPALTEGEICTLVVQDKWIADITTAIGAEVEARTEALTARVRVLTERYGQTLPQITEDLGVLEARVAGHLAAMGVAG